MNISDLHVKKGFSGLVVTPATPEAERLILAAPRLLKAAKAVWEASAQEPKFNTEAMVSALSELDYAINETQKTPEGGES